jgi:hypothetical protein
MKMKIIWIKLLVFFLGLSLFENIAFPLAANHGRFDVYNKSFQPYLLMALFALGSIIVLSVIIFKRPSPKTGLYNFSKIIAPLITIFLIVNVTGLVPSNLTIASILIFTFHVTGIVISFWFCIILFLNKELNK